MFILIPLLAPIAALIGVGISALTVLPAAGSAVATLTTVGLAFRKKELERDMGIGLNSVYEEELEKQGGEGTGLFRFSLNKDKLPPELQDLAGVWILTKDEQELLDAKMVAKVGGEKPDFHHLIWLNNKRQKDPDIISQFREESG